MEVPAFPAHWRVGAPALIAETAGCRIWRVRRDGGGTAVVKAMKPVPDAFDELRGAHYLRWRDGHGAVRLLGADADSMLLEDAGDLHLGAHLASHGDAAATEIAADVLSRLLSASPSPAPAALQPLCERFAALFARARADRGAGGHSIYGEAAAEAERLLGEQRDVRPLHGDLHHDNIMHGARGWVAIDPKGVFGDSAYDAANLFYNPMDRDALCFDPARIAAMTETLAGRLGFDRRRLLAWAFAYGCLSAAWFAEDDAAEEERRELALARRIREVAAHL